jgi:arylsulfatase A-like enzyme
MVHAPLAASENFLGKSGSGLLGDAIEELDWSVGQIMQTLKELQLDERTLVIFTSDNGAAAGSSAPWRGKKGSNFEGGVREPCIMRWPGRIPAGTTCNQIAGNIDLLPTFAKLVGVAVPSDRVLDGREITSLMFDSKAGPARDTHLYFTGNSSLAAIRQGDWKLILPAPAGNAKAKQNKVRGNTEKTAPAGPFLFNLAMDPAETNDVSSDHPEIAANLKAEAVRREDEIKKDRRPVGTLHTN